MNTKYVARIMIAKPGLDGHDRGAVVVVQGLRDAGFDLIYTGLRRTAREIAIAAAQEDVDVLGLSCLSGAHLTLMKDVVDELGKIDWRPSVLIAGGIIPANDAETLRAMGFDFVFGPGTRLEDIASSIRTKIPERGRRPQSATQWVARSQELTSLEYQSTVVKTDGKKNRGRICVIIGQGGAGKSTLIGALLRAADAAGKSVAVIANDPAGENGRGAILADRLRMPMNLNPERILIRSLPVRGESIGVSGISGQMAGKLAEWFDLVLIETIGVGQNQTTTAPWVDERVAILAPGMGDHWQLRKSAIVQTADRIVINKSDLPSADSFAAEVNEVLHDSRSDNPPVNCTSDADATSATTLLEALMGGTRK
jgi:methylmalonyl-CoA mutase C-terminal domain/subunit